ncbi:MAG: hypothetical protein ACRENJ_07055 [Candidatus Eiseniibacteriota bacterium]
MHHVKSSPPLSLLRIYVERLEAGGLRVALAGSGLLAALGFGDTIRDWDLTTDAPYERAVEALAGEAFVSHGSDDLHADRKLALSGGAVELIVRFAFHARGGVIRIPTIVSARMEGIPIGSPECWAIAYHLLGRERKSEALFAHLARHGAHRETVARLLEEPLPPSLAARLEALPTSRRT